MFLIDIPQSSRPEREYALAVLVGDWLGATYTLRVADDLRETRIRVAAEPDGPEIIIPDVLLARDTAWLSPESLPSPELPRVRMPPWTGMDDELPLLFAKATDDDALVSRHGSRFELRLDLLGSLIFLLTRYEEYVPPQTYDEHGRVAAGASALAKSGWLQWPVLDMYFEVFQSLLRMVWPRMHLEPKQYPRIVVGHDVDHPSSPIRWHGMARPRIVVGDLVRRRNPGLAIRRAVSIIGGTADISRFDPYNTYRFLMETSESAGVASTFFFLTKETEVPSGSRYLVNNSWGVRLMREIADRGHHVGLHGGYNSSTDATRLREEWSLLANACRGLPPGVLRRTIRQHFLRWRAGTTWRMQAEAGLTMDESLSFADAIGYRAGTSRSFHAYDLNEHRQLPLRVQPLHVMDGTLLGYMSLGLEDAYLRVTEMAARTRRYGGSFSILWHNSALETRSVRQFYRGLLSELAS